MAAESSTLRSFPCTFDYCAFIALDSDNTSFIITTIYTPSRKKLGGNVFCIIRAVYRYGIFVRGYDLHIFSIKKGLVLFGLALAVKLV